MAPGVGAAIRGEESTARGPNKWFRGPLDTYRGPFWCFGGALEKSEISTFWWFLTPTGTPSQAAHWHPQPGRHPRVAVWAFGALLSAVWRKRNPGPKAVYSWGQASGTPSGGRKAPFGDQKSGFEVHWTLIGVHFGVLGVHRKSQNFRLFGGF